MSIDGPTMFAMAAAELEGVEEAKRVIAKLQRPLALAVCACWLNAVIKRMDGTGAVPFPPGLLERYERTAAEQLERQGL